MKGDDIPEEKAWLYPVCFRCGRRIEFFPDGESFLTARCPCKHRILNVAAYDAENRMTPLEQSIFLNGGSAWKGNRVDTLDEVRRVAKEQYDGIDTPEKFVQVFKKNSFLRAV